MRSCAPGLPPVRAFCWIFGTRACTRGFTASLNDRLWLWASFGRPSLGVSRAPDAHDTGLERAALGNLCTITADGDEAGAVTAGRHERCASSPLRADCSGWGEVSTVWLDTFRLCLGHAPLRRVAHAQDGTIAQARDPGDGVESPREQARAEPRKLPRPRHGCARCLFDSFGDRFRIRPPSRGNPRRLSIRPARRREASPTSRRTHAS